MYIRMSNLLHYLTQGLRQLSVLHNHELSTRRLLLPRHIDPTKRPVVGLSRVGLIAWRSPQKEHFCHEELSLRGSSVQLKLTRRIGAGSS